VGALAIVRSPASKEQNEFRYAKSIALHLWLFGYEVPGEPRLLAPPSVAHRLLLARALVGKQTRFASSRQRASPSSAPPRRARRAAHARRARSRARSLGAGASRGSRAEARGPLCHRAPRPPSPSARPHASARQFIDRPKSGGEEQVAQLLAQAHSACGSRPLGVLPKEKADGGAASLWAAQVAGSGLAVADVASGLGRLMAPKDAAEQGSLRRAANLTVAVLDKALLPQIEAAAESEKKARSARLAHFPPSRSRELAFLR